MAEVRPKMSWGVEEEAIMEILFGEEIKCLGSDGFEGSEEERRICLNVLYEVNISNFSNALSKMGNSQSKQCSLNKQPGFANTENLVNISGHVEVNNNNVNGVLGSKRHRLQAMTSSNNTNAKRLKISSSDPFQIKELLTTISKNGNKLLSFCPPEKSNSSTAPYSVTVENSLSTSVDKRSDKALPPDPLNSKEVDEIEKAKLCESNGGKESNSYVIKKNYHSISEHQHNSSSQEAGEVKKSGMCKKRGRKKQHSVEINDGSSQEEGEVRKTVVCNKRMKEGTNSIATRPRDQAK